MTTGGAESFRRPSMTTRDACGACIAALVGRPGEGAGFQRGLLEGRLLPGERLPGSMRGDDERRVSVQRRSVLSSTGDWVGLCRPSGIRGPASMRTRPGSARQWKPKERLAGGESRATRTARGDGAAPACQALFHV